jgi:signal transduction histidine kinase
MLCFSSGGAMTKKNRRPLVTRLFLPVVTVLALLTSVSWYANGKLVEAADWVAHTLKVLTTLEQIKSNLAEAESAQRGYFMQRSPGFLIERERALDAARSDVAAIKILTQDNPLQSDRIDLLSKLSLQKIIAAVESGQIATVSGDAPSGYFEKNASINGQLMQVIAEIKEEESNLLASRHADASLKIEIARGSFMLLMLALTLVLFFLVKRIRQDLLRKEQAAEALRIVNNELEIKVQLRTVDLNESNMLLKLEIVGHKEAEKALQESRFLLEQLASHQDSIKEEERKRIAREIHDELGQRLLVLRIDVSLLQTRIRDPRALFHDKVGVILADISTIMHSVRSIINDLRPAVLDLGLHASIEWQLQQFQHRTGIECVFLPHSHEVELTDHGATSLFRVLQESLTNVRRHSQATRVEVLLDADERHVLMAVSDNGDGSADVNVKKTNSYGLLGMKERIARLGGAIRIVTAPGQGFSISVTIPNGVHSALDGATPVIAAELKSLLVELLVALDTDNPAPVELVLAALGEKIKASELMPISTCVRGFDFRGAEASTRQLANERGVNL